MIGLASAQPVIMVHTADRARALPFWRDVLGLPLQSEDAFGAVFLIGQTQLRLSDVEGWSGHPHTILGFNVPDIVAEIDRLVAAGVEFQHYDGFGQDARGIWASPDGAVHVAWFLDPDGNNLSLSQGL